MRVLMVTSATPGEGKTTMAMHLAAVLAQAGSRVLLVDADLRRPRVHTILGLDRGPGLSELLEGREPKPVRQTEIPGISVITAGRTPADPGALLGGMELEALLADLGQDFDCVILDSAPVLGLADAPVISTKVDAVLLVAAADGAPRAAVRDSVKRLRLVRAPLVGALLNRVDFKRDGYGYYGSHYYSYGPSDDSTSAAG